MHGGLLTSMATRAADVSTSHQWQNDPFQDNRRAWLDVFRQNLATIGFSFAAGLLVIGWLLRDYNLLSAEEGVGYMLGIVSVLCMVTLLLYPLRKKFRVLKFIGPLPKWFRNHMVLGVSAPIVALYHCNFQLGSLNSRIALFSALTVAGSGLIGRFIYSKIHRGLYGRKTNLKELLARVKVTAPGVGTMGSFLPELTERMTRFDRDVLVPPDSIFRLSSPAIRPIYSHTIALSKIDALREDLIKFSGATVARNFEASQAARTCCP